MAEMRRFAVALVLLPALAVSSGCAPPLHFFAPRVVFRAPPRPRARPRPPAAPATVPLTTSATTTAGPAGLVERSLHERGLTFGTDGSVASLYELLNDSQTPVAPSQAQPGDVVFFDLGAGCGGHVGLVEAVDREGRIAFRERRAGEVLRSYADPGQPTARRDAQGRIRNSFLRPRRPEDPPSYRYFAGEMLCEVIRVRRH
jgi:hypothetical protein